MSIMRGKEKRREEGGKRTEEKPNGDDGRFNGSCDPPNQSAAADLRRHPNPVPSFALPEEPPLLQHPLSTSSFLLTFLPLLGTSASAAVLFSPSLLFVFKATNVTRKEPLYCILVRGAVGRKEDAVGL